MPTINEVSQLAKVSKATVSRVLNNKDRVAPATRLRVLAAIEQLGFEPNAVAKGLATSRSNSIGVMANGIGSPHFGYIVKGIQEVVEPLDLLLIVTDGHHEPELQKKAIKALLKRRCDAFIISLEDYTHHDIQGWKKFKAPIIVIGPYYLEVIKDQLVYHDNVLGAKLAVEHLIAKGHRRIAHIAGPTTQHTSLERLQGYRLALEEAGIQYDSRIVLEGRYSEKSGRQAMHELLDAGLTFTALFAANDLTAAGAMGALRKRGFDIPKDVSIVGYDNITLARCLYPPLTTVRSPLVEKGQAAAQLALKALGYYKEEVIHRFEPTLIERESVAELTNQKLLVTKEK